MEQIEEEKKTKKEEPEGQIKKEKKGPEHQEATEEALKGQPNKTRGW